MGLNKKFEVVDLGLKVPEEFHPEWYRQGYVPINVELNNKEPINEAKMLNRQGYKAISIEDESEIPKIKEALQMQSNKESQWYDNLAEDGEAVDNNESVDVDSLQKHKISLKEIKPNDKEMAPSDLTTIRSKLLQKRKVEDKARVASPGEFVVWFCEKVVHVGNLNATKEICEKLIVENEDIQDDDLMIFLRIPVAKLFK